MQKGKREEEAADRPPDGQGAEKLFLYTPPKPTLGFLGQLSLFLKTIGIEQRAAFRLLGTGYWLS